MPTQAGLQVVVDIAYAPSDRVRPRMKFAIGNAHGWRRNTTEMETIREMQQLLIDLGPVLVELGMLQK